ncbi:MAG TPA: HAMP domain-containing sensor histidine kinase [Sphingobacterium sp.]|nr:HAMP domain-containing sensor histidine kinase [Sphingobacterium sp.]
MLRRYKIILGIIILTVGGILFILTIWLSGTYKNREELFTSNAERLLFNVVQDFYQQNKIAEEREATEPVRLRSADRRMIRMVKELYPEIDENKIRREWESIQLERYKTADSIRKARIEKRVRQEPQQIVPAFLLRQIDFDEQVLGEISDMLKKELSDQSLPGNFRLAVQEFSDADSIEARVLGDSELLTVRPILVDPGQNQYLVATFEKPWKYILWKMNWQLILSILLASTLLGTFVYLMRVISKQNRLGVLRKSFVNNMTHELKTPISTVMAAIEAVQRFGAKDDKEKSFMYIELARKELQHLANMVERVLQIDVDESQKIALIKTEVDLVALAKECIETVKITSDEKVDIELESKEKKLKVFADKSHLRNVINNLLENAIKYSFESVEIKIVLLKKDNEAIIEVEDKGKGISPVHQKNVFDMFFRVPEGNVHTVKGFGLGLAYVKQIIQSHDGHVGLQSQINKGSKFIVSIPIK